MIMFIAIALTMDDNAIVIKYSEHSWINKTFRQLMNCKNVLTRLTMLSTIVPTNVKSGRNNRAKQNRMRTEPVTIQSNQQQMRMPGMKQSGLNTHKSAADGRKTRKYTTKRATNILVL